MKLRIHPSGALLWAAGFVFFPSRLVIASIVALLWHEAAHVAAMLLCGVKNCTIEITPFGGMADVKEYARLSACKQAVCAFSGVMGSLSGMLLCSLMPDSAFIYALKQIHFSLALFNCLPLWPLDGARTIVALVSVWGFQHGAKKVLSALSVLLGIGLSLLALYGAWHGVMNLSLLFSGPYLCYAAREGQLSEKMRNIVFYQKKFSKNALLPVKAYASSEPCPKMLGRLSADRYTVLFQIGNDGIQKIWTEDELLQQYLNTEGIGKSCK